MKLDGDYVFEASVQDVWDALFDPQVLAAVLPGCEKLELVDGQYVGDIKVKVGPIQGKFTGKVDLFDKVEPTSYRMKIDGRGAQGFVNASATIELAGEGEKTRIKYTSESNIGGKIASVGSRLVETSAKAIVKQSLEGLNENIKLRAAAYREHAANVAAARTDAPTAARTDAPTASRTDAPTAARTDAPTASRTDAPASTSDEPTSAGASTTTPVATTDVPASTSTSAAPAAPPDAPVAASSAAVARIDEGAEKTDAPASTSAESTAKTDGAAANSDAPASAEPAATRAKLATTDALAATGDSAAKSDASAEPAAAEPSKPVIAYKKADVGKLGAAVAKEVGKSLAPYLVAGALVIGVVVYLLLR
ncbi:MAG: SRPBCC domain-containing protein [Kofleriaceae bacterium]